MKHGVKTAIPLFRQESRQGPRQALAAGLALLAMGGTLGGTTQVQAETFRLASASDGVIGAPFYVKTRREDTLLDIGRHNDLGYDDMNTANPKVDMWVPGAGAQALVPTFYVLPQAPRQAIVLNVPEKRMYYYPEGSDGTTVATYAISIGREGWNTPIGTFKITSKVKDPTWTPPASIHAERAAEGRPPLPAVVRAGPDNPLGQYAMRLSAPSVLIHGTNKPWGLGMQVTHGCIRMYPEDLEQLFGKVAVNTPVTIVNQPFKVGWLGDDLYLEVHIAADDDKGKDRDPRSIVPGSVANVAGVYVDWESVRRARDENTGLPVLVGGRRRSADWLHLDMVF
jgi:L,D-transpeptidase ErfK/SrfK